MNFLPAMAIRSTDANEARYIRRAMRSLRKESVLLGVLCLSFLAGGGAVIVDVFNGRNDFWLLLLGGVCVMIGGGATYWFGVRWWKARGRGSSLVYRVEGQLSKVVWRDSEGTRQHHWELDDHRLIIPDHWGEVLENENPYGTVSAEVVPGPGGELIPLRIGDRLSISHDVQFGLLSLPSKALLFVWLMVAVVPICGIALKFIDREVFETMRPVTYWGGVLAGLLTPWAIADMIRIRIVSRRLIRNLPPDPRDQKTPGPSL